MTRTTEQLRERIRGLEITLQHKNWEAVKADLECLKELLAVREAHSAPIGCIKTICGNKTLRWWRDAPEGAEVFTAPPAVPDFGVLTKLIVSRLIDCGTASDDSIADAEVFVYNTCRAAMLQPVSQGCALPAGWIACSDRMPTEGGRYLAWVEEQNSLGLSCYVDNVAWHDDAVGFRATGAVNFWMPLPAAPTPTKVGE